MKRGFNMDEDYDARPTNQKRESSLKCIHDTCHQPGVYGEGEGRWICSFHKFGITIKDELENQALRDIAAREANMRKRKGPTLRDQGLTEERIKGWR